MRHNNSGHSIKLEPALGMSEFPAAVKGSRVWAAKPGHFVKNGESGRSSLWLVWVGIFHDPKDGGSRPCIFREGM